MKTLEDLIVDLGGFGRAQILIVVLVNILRACSGWTMLMMSFANFVPKWCCMPDNQTDTAELYCREDVANGSENFAKTCDLNSTRCDVRVFASGVRSVVSEWDLVCERKWMVPLTTSIQMVGVMVGAMLAGQLTDLIGRKKCVFLFSSGGAVFNIVAGFSVSWEMFVAIRFVLGMSVGGHITSGVPYQTEFLPSFGRALTAALPTFSVGGMFLALVSWRIPDWRMIHWILGATTAPILIGYFFIPESLRWLAVKGREEEAQKAVEWVARLNKKEVPKYSREVIQAVAVEAKTTGKEKKYTYIHIYKGWHLFKSSVILQYMWCVLSLTGYGISFSAASLGTNMYLNIFLMNLITCSSFIFTSSLAERLGRKKTAILFFALSGGCCFAALGVKLVVTSVSTQTTAILVLSLSARTFLATAWTCVLLTTNEIYPTVIRGLGYGASNVVSRVGAIIAPFAINFEDNPVLTITLLAVLLTTAGLSNCFLDETGGKAMQETTMAITSQPSDLETIEMKPQQKGDAIVVESCAGQNSSHDYHEGSTDGMKNDEFKDGSIDGMKNDEFKDGSIDGVKNDEFKDGSIDGMKNDEFKDGSIDGMKNDEFKDGSIDGMKNDEFNDGPIDGMKNVNNHEASIEEKTLSH